MELEKTMFHLTDTATIRNSLEAEELIDSGALSFLHAQSRGHVQPPAIQFTARSFELRS